MSFENLTRVELVALLRAWASTLEGQQKSGVAEVWSGLRSLADAIEFGKVTCLHFFIPDPPTD